MNAYTAYEYIQNQCHLFHAHALHLVGIQYIYTEG